MSNDSVARDRADKFYEYQAAGVIEYWIIDPRPGYERVDFYVLDATGRYRPVPVDADGRYHSAVLDGFWLHVDWVLAAEPPEVLRVLAQVVGRQKLLEALGVREETERERVPCSRPSVLAEGISKPLSQLRHAEPFGPSQVSSRQARLSFYQEPPLPEAGATEERMR